jgi:CBS domain-containing protein
MTPRVIPMTPRGGQMNIASILAKKGGQVFTAQPGQTVRQALALLAEHNVGVLLVVGDEGGRPVGVLSERDIVRHLARNEDLLGQRVDSIMTRDVIVGQPQDDLLTVGHTMVERHIRHLPVMNGGQLVGLVSIGDIMKAQRDQYQGEVDTLQIQLLESPPDQVRQK